MNSKKTSATLFCLAGFASLAGFIIWIATGAHPGWTQTNIPRTIVDEVTGIEAVVFEDGFVAGIDFLGAILLLGTGLCLIGWMIRRRPDS